MVKIKFANIGPWHSEDISMLTRTNKMYLVIIFIDRRYG